MLYPGGRGQTIYGVVLAELIVAILLVLVRLYARFWHLGGLRADDYVLVVAMLLLIALSVTMILCVYHGIGWHLRAFKTFDDIIELSKLTYIWAIQLSIVVFATKLCVATFLLQLVAYRSHKMILWVSSGICAALAIAQVISLFTGCIPLEANWNIAIRGKCANNIFIINYCLSAYGILLDFFYALLPIFFFRALQIPVREKYVVCASLGTGVLAGIAGIVRLVFIVRFDRIEKTTDPLYHVWKSIVWTHTENTISLICVCFPAIRTLYSRLRKESKSRYVSQESGSSKRSERSKRPYILHDRSRNDKSMELADLTNSSKQTSNRFVEDTERSASVTASREVLPGITTIGDPAQNLGTMCAVARADSEGSVERIVGGNEDRIVARYSYSVSTQPQI